MLANPLQFTLERLHADLMARTEGDVATYIPELGLANPEHFGLSIATVDGHSYSVGNFAEPFTIQSISKPFVYGLALDDIGVERVLAKVGVEPSGEAFNAISLEAGTGRPRNPMINAGAIASAGLVQGGSPGEKFGRIEAMLSGYAGRCLDVSESVFQSEKDTGHRNRAIGHLLRNAGVLEGDVDEVCDRYFRQCSVLVTAEDLARMAATLANGGVNPRTGQRVVAAEHVERILAVMSTCGMYDAAGAWVYRVGMPAKSGVGGGVLAVLPGQLGIGVFSPRLDAFGNSVRGVAACEELSREFSLHLLRPPLSLDSVMRASYHVPQLRSRRQRTSQEMAILETEGQRAHVFQLQGALVFSTAEIAFRHALDRIVADGLVVFDMRRVTGFDRSVGRLLVPFMRDLAEGGGVLVFAGPCKDSWCDTIREAAAAAGVEAGVMILADLDAALEFCEDQLLASSIGDGQDAELAFSDHPLVARLSADAEATLEALAVREVFAAASTIVTCGDDADALYLLAAGLVEVSIGSGTARHRITTLGPGTTFGEVALIDGGKRSADVAALTDVVCYRLSLGAIAGAENGVRLQLVEALARDLAERLRRANEEIAILAS